MHVPSVICGQSLARWSRFLNLLMNLTPVAQYVGESATKLFELLFNMEKYEDTKLYLKINGLLTIVCRLITNELARIEA